MLNLIKNQLHEINIETPKIVWSLFREDLTIGENNKEKLQGKPQSLCKTHSYISSENRCNI